VSPNTGSGSVSTKAGTLFLWIGVPIGLAFLLKGVGWDRAAVVTALAWKSIVFPHDWVVRRTSTGSSAAFPFDIAILVALTQWVSAAFVFGYLARKRSITTTIWVAPLVIIAVGLLVNLLMAVAGLTVEWP
jgi:hypothetical protein